MTSIEKAVEAAEQRKSAIFGSEDDSPRLETGTKDGERAVYSGFDINVDELHEVAGRAGLLFARHADYSGLVPLFEGCWADGFLVGLLAARQAN
jgi:hypothetical protein